MLVRGLAVSIRVLAMVMSRGRVLFRLFVVAMIMMMRRLAVVMGCRFVLCSGIVMMRARRVLLFLCHGKFLLQYEILGVSGQRALLTSATNFRTEPRQKKPTWPNTRRHSTTSAYSSTGLPARPGCPSPSHPTSKLIL